GKPAAADLYRRKVTLPIIRAMRDVEHREILTDLYRREALADADVHRILAILDATTIRSDMETLVRRMAQAARETPKVIKLPPTAAASQARGQLHAAVSALLPIAGL